MEGGSMMRKILGVILILPALLSGWGCAGTQDVPGVEKETKAEKEAEKRGYEITVIEEFEYFTISQGIKVHPFENEVGEKMPSRLLERIPGDIERRIKEEGLLFTGIRRVAIRGKITEVSDGPEGKVVAARVEFFDPHNRKRLGTVEIRGRARGPGSLDRATAAIVLAVSELTKERSKVPVPTK